jgi:bacterioferritin-associated ferredoxin
MIVCHCRAVRDHEVCDAIERGARDAEAIAFTCGAGSVCGGCVPTINALLSGTTVRARRTRERGIPLTLSRA